MYYDFGDGFLLCSWICRILEFFLDGISGWRAVLRNGGLDFSGTEEMRRRRNEKRHFV